jgi:hypothetical protein
MTDQPAAAGQTEAAAGSSSSGGSAALDISEADVAAAVAE